MSIYAEVCLKDKELEAALKDKIGGWGENPPNMVEISEDDFFKEFLLWAWPYMDFRQVHKNRWVSEDGEFELHSMKMWFNDDGNGIMIGTGLKVREGKYRDRRFFKFAACIHEWETTKTANCYREMKCKKCGATNAIDSSD